MRNSLSQREILNHFVTICGKEASVVVTLIGQVAETTKYLIGINEKSTLLQ